MQNNRTIRLTLIRGLPGSGKSTLAEKMAQESPAIHLETDMFFVDKQGSYNFNPKLLPQAHQWCQQQTHFYLQQGHNVIVSNTFVQHWEMKAYQKIARQLQVELEILVCNGNYGSVHDIEPSTLAKMKKNWQA